MRKSRWVGAPLLGLWCLMPGPAHADWVDDVCEEHPKREFCRATICEKLSQGCLRFAATPAATGGTRYVLTPYPGQPGSSDRKLEWLKDGPVVDKAGGSRRDVDPLTLYKEYARKYGKSSDLANVISSDTTEAYRTTAREDLASQKARDARIKQYEGINRQGVDNSKLMHDSLPSDTLKNRILENKGLPTR